jgi:peptidoglycan/LPS O-acetylase OafA/YrhL
MQTPMILTSDTKTTRIPAVDFTKGALVLLMVLYHWLNYFIGSQTYIYRYIRFITPSFIFITGYLVSSAYVSKRNLADPRIPRRLMKRGIKILGIFVLLNVAVSLLLYHSHTGAMLREHISAADVIARYVTGNIFVGDRTKVVSFYILAPISCLLLLSAALMSLCRMYKYVFQVVCAVFLSSILVLDLNGVASPNLELVTIGLLGVVIGYIPIEKIKTVIGQPSRLSLAYMGYLIAITVWNVVYPLQVVGVCLNLMAIYLLGTRTDDFGGVGRTILLLGKYSLFAYIAQIGILQLLHRVMQNVDLGAGTVYISLIAALALTIMTVRVVDRMRVRSAVVNRLYGAVFS